MTAGTLAHLTRPCQYYGAPRPRGPIDRRLPQRLASESRRRYSAFMMHDEVKVRAIITGTGSYLPEAVIGNEALAKELDTTKAWILDKTGVSQRRRAADGQSNSDMAAIASKRALEAADLSPADLDLIVVATSTADSPLPASAALLQQKIGAEMIPAFDVAASGAGFLYALTIAEQFIASGTYANALVVGSELVSALLDSKDPVAASLFGDGAGAVVLTRDDRGVRGVLASKLHADGNLVGLMQVPGGGSAQPLTAESLVDGQHHLRVSDPAAVDAPRAQLARHVADVLREAEVKTEQVDWVLPRQAIGKLDEALVAEMGVPADKLINNQDRCGNMLSASLPVALDEAVRSGRIAEGQNVLLCTLGPGVTWAATMLRM